MAAIGGLTIGLCIVLGGFVLVLVVELYYLIYWKCQSPWNRSRIVNKSTATGFNLIREAADREIPAISFPISTGVIACNDSLYMQGVGEGPSVLFTINEETKEEMEYEESVGEHKNTFSDSDSEQGLSNSQRPSCSKSPSTNKNSSGERCHHQEQKQWSDLHSIGLLPQQQKMQESRCYSNPASPSERMKLSDHLGQPFPSGSSPPSAPGRFVSLSFPRSFSWRNNHIPLASAGNESLRPYRKRQSFYSAISNPIYDTAEMPPLPTPLGTAVSFPFSLTLPY